MMNKTLIACLSLVVGLSINGTVQGADEPTEEQNRVVAQNEQGGDKDLLMFFEEQDLVTATKRPISLRKVPAIATIIDADDIKNMGARNLVDVLKMVSGFGISTNEFGANMIEVRGIRTSINEKILFMIDGHSLNKNFTGSALYNVADMVPLENVRQIEVVKGPGSALYGNSAFVATINVITRKAEEINGLEAKGGGGSFDTYKGNLLGGKAIGDKLTISGSLDQYQTNGAKLKVDADALGASGTADSGFRQTDAFLKVGYGDFSFRGHYLTRQKNLYIGMASALTDDSSKDQVDNYWGELAYNRRLAEGLSVNMKLSYDYYEQNPSLKIYPNGYAGLPDGWIAKPMVKDRTIGGELQVDWDMFKNNHLIAGFSFEELRQYDTRFQANYDPLPPFTPLSSVQDVVNWNKDVTRQIYATYLQDEWQLPAKINLTTGVRYDHYSDFGDTVNPRIGLVWSFLENADLKLLYGQAFRAPSFQELYNDHNPTVVGNPNLKPERIKTYEASLAWRLSRQFAANVTYFYSTINDQIGWEPSTTPGTAAVNANLSKSETQGVEFGANGAYGPDLYWKLSYSWQDPRDAATNKRLPYVPSQRASGSVNYSLSKHVNLHSDLLWTGPRPRPQGDTRPEMPDYTTVDLAVTLKNFFRTLEIQGTVHNLLDKCYSDPDTSGSAAKVPGDFPREGISGFVTASYKF